jgi:hypothetical protein
MLVLPTSEMVPAACNFLVFDSGFKFHPIYYIFNQSPIGIFFLSLQRNFPISQSIIIDNNGSQKSGTKGALESFCRS